MSGKLFLEFWNWTLCKPCKGKRNSLVIVRQPDAEDDEDADQSTVPKGDSAPRKTTGESAVLQAIQKSQDFLSSKVDNIMKEFTALKEENAGLKERMKFLEMKCSSLEHTVYNMEHDADVLKRQQLAGNLIIHGVPYSSNEENPTQFVMDIAARLDSPLAEGSILSCARLTNSKKAVSNKAPLMVKFADPAIKRELVTKLRRKKFLLVSEVFAHSSNDDRAKISLRDDLTPLQRTLYKEAKNLQQMFELRFAWMRDGDIFVRKEENSKVYAINSKFDLMKLAEIFTKK